MRTIRQVTRDGWLLPRRLSSARAERLVAAGLATWLHAPGAEADTRHGTVTRDFDADNTETVRDIVFLFFADGVFVRGVSADVADAILRRGAGERIGKYAVVLTHVSSHSVAAYELALLAAGDALRAAARRQEWSDAIRFAAAQGGTERDVEARIARLVGTGDAAHLIHKMREINRLVSTLDILSDNDCAAVRRAAGL